MIDKEHIPRPFWVRYRKRILVIAMIYCAVVVLLIALAWGPQNNPFQYQIF
jgi:hypothetical protein